jgi:hypothetical protein
MSESKVLRKVKNSSGYKAARNSEAYTGHLVVLGSYAGLDMWLGGHKECIQNFGEETSSKRPLRRRRRNWEDNIKMDV